MLDLQKEFDEFMEQISEEKKLSMQEGDGSLTLTQIERIELLEEQAQKAANLPPGCSIQFRAVRVNVKEKVELEPATAEHEAVYQLDDEGEIVQKIVGSRIHSLLVDVYKVEDGLFKRYTAGLRRRLSLGIRDFSKWKAHLDEAISIALENPPIQSIKAEDKGLRRTINTEDCRIIVIGKWVSSANGPVDEVFKLLKELKSEENK